jgi:hypothetical protein
VHARPQTEDRSDDSFDEELEQVFDQFPEHHMKMLFGDFNAEIGRRDILKTATASKILYDDNDEDDDSIPIYYSANLTAQRPITKLAQNNYKTNCTNKRTKQHNKTVNKNLTETETQVS